MDIIDNIGNGIYPTPRKFESSEKPKTDKVIYILIGLVLFFIIVSIFFFIFSGGSICGDGNCDKTENCFICLQDCGSCPVSSICGDNICESGENCYDCPKDCKCGKVHYCSFEEKKCVKPICGNEICESYESPSNCCLDCKCTFPGEICNKKTKKCRIPEMNLTDERAIGLTTKHFENLGLEVTSIEILGVGSYNKKLIKKVRVKFFKENWFVYVGITEDGKIIELPIS